MSHVLWSRCCKTCRTCKISWCTSASTHYGPTAKVWLRLRLASSALARAFHAPPTGLRANSRRYPAETSKDKQRQAMGQITDERHAVFQWVEEFGKLVSIVKI